MKRSVVFPSSRSYIVFLEMSRVYVNSMRVVYSTVENARLNTYNIPDLNTSVLILGTGTSITQQAVRMLRESGVIIMFSGNDGFPLYYADMMYKPTEYLHKYARKWYSEEYRLNTSKFLQSKRFDYIIETWNVGPNEKALMNKVKERLSTCKDIKEILGVEGNAVRRLIYPNASKLFNPEWKGRDRTSSDAFNQRLNRANVIIYGMVATVLSSLGIPPSFAVTHGETRRGGLVYDIADVYKDAIGLPLCLKSSYDPHGSDFRQELTNHLHTVKIGGSRLFQKMFSDTKEMISL